MPPLPALLGDAPGQLLSYRGPLSGAVRAHQFDDFGLGAAREGSGARERSTGGPKIPTLRADVLFGRPRPFRSFLVCLARPCRRSRRRRRRSEPRRRARRRARGPGVGTPSLPRLSNVLLFCCENAAATTIGRERLAVAKLHLVCTGLWRCPELHRGPPIANPIKHGLNYVRRSPELPHLISPARGTFAGPRSAVAQSVT